MLPMEVAQTVPVPLTSATFCAVPPILIVASQIYRWFEAVPVITTAFAAKLINARTRVPDVQGSSVEGAEPPIFEMLMLSSPVNRHSANVCRPVVQDCAPAVVLARHPNTPKFVAAGMALLFVSVPVEEAVTVPVIGCPVLRMVAMSA